MMELVVGRREVLFFSFMSRGCLSCNRMFLSWALVTSFLELLGFLKMPPKLMN